jgi:hypothetical protein
MAQHASTAVALAALAMMAPALVPGTASAQQVAANATPDLSACDQIKDPAKSAQCSHDQVMRNLRERNEAALKRQREADTQVECVKEITALRRDETFGSKATEIARELVKASGRPVADIDACALRDGVRAGLTRLKLLPARVSMN